MDRRSFLGMTTNGLLGGTRVRPGFVAGQPSADFRTEIETSGRYKLIRALQRMDGVWVRLEPIERGQSRWTLDFVDWETWPNDDVTVVICSEHPSPLIHFPGCPCDITMFRPQAPHEVEALIQFPAPLSARVYIVTPRVDEVVILASPA